MLAEYSQDFWMVGTLVFMALTVVLGVTQLFRDKQAFDLPVFVLAPVTWLWLIMALAGLVTGMLVMLVAVVQWIVR